MLFTSYEYVLAFLPLCLLAFYCLRRHGRLQIAFLVACSLLFYAWWDPRYLPLFLFSIGMNFTFGRILVAMNDGRWRRATLAIAVGANLCLLVYFKYSNFLISNIQAVSGTNFDLASVILPIGISFYTFTQIAFICDVYNREADGYSLLEYTLFVSFFPHLIAGPILHHREIVPQFAKWRWQTDQLAMGLMLITIGLFKKIVIADSLAPYVNFLFEISESQPVTFLPAWTAALSYTFQIYFDFSGYTDIAIGSALMFGVRFPLNFDSPYKATSIVDFWRRWHMTLSRFLRDYLYVPLGGNRRGGVRRYGNLLAVMLLGGLWHGAAWTFVAWGALHGVYLIANHAWRTWVSPSMPDTPAVRAVYWLVTFVAVVVAWVVFRAESFPSALNILGGMLGLNGIDLEQRHARLLVGLVPWLGALAIPVTATEVMSATNLVGALGCIVVCLVLPNSQSLVLGAGNTVLRWRSTPVWGALAGAVAAGCVALIQGHKEFIYFDF